MKNSDKGSLDLRSFFIGFLLLAIFALALSRLPISCLATQPHDLKIEDISDESMARIRVEIWHDEANITDCPCTSHYIDAVEVDVNGQIEQFTLKTKEQTTNPFSVELELGEIKETLNVRARAHCNHQYWSDWYGPIQIAKQSMLSDPVVLTIPAFVALVSLIFIMKRFKKEETSSD